MPESEELESQKVRLKANGDLVTRADGKETIVAHYDKATGRLEYASRQASEKFHSQVTTRLGTVGDGTQVSANVIRSIGIIGEAASTPTGKRPRMGKEGDATPALVDWYIRNSLAEAVVRYRIRVGTDGKPIRRTASRQIQVVEDNRNGAEPPVPTPVKGQSYEGGPVRRTSHIITVRNAIIGDRPTRYEDDPEVLERFGVEKMEAVFSPNEVVGGLQPEDQDFEEVTAGGEAKD